MTTARLISPDPRAAQYAEAGVWGRVTLDALFRRNLARSPDRPALIDAPDRPAVTGREPRRLTYRQADQAIGTLAARLRELGLRPGAVVGLQLPNTVEGPIAILATIRAGLVPAVLPLLWRTREIVPALAPLAPKALIGIARAGPDAPADLLRYAAAELFSVRFVLAFGSGVPDGVIALDETFTGTAREPRPAPPSSPVGEAPAMITFRAVPNGHAPVARSHNHWVSAGLAILIESRMEPAEVIAGAMLATSFAGLSATLMPWLLTGSTLVLHQPFDPAAFRRAVEAEHATRLVVPGLALPDIAASLKGTVKTILAVHTQARAAARRESVPTAVDIVDVIGLDEWALVAARRKNGAPRPLPLGPLRQPGDAAGGPMLVETLLTPEERIAVRGPMVPYDPDGADGARVTGLRGRAADGQIEILGRADELAFIGGLGVAPGEIEAHLLTAEEVEAVRVTAVADPMFGERIEAHVAPRAVPPIPVDTLVERLRRFLAMLGLASYKIPSRIVIDPKVRADPKAKLRTPMSAARPAVAKT